MSEASFSLAVRLARRELRGGVRGFRIFIACLALGVAAIAGVGSVSTALTRGLSERGQEILGGDVDVRLLHRQTNAAEYAALAKDNAVSRTVEMRAMARRCDAEPCRAKGCRWGLSALWHDAVDTEHAAWRGAVVARRRLWRGG